MTTNSVSTNYMPTVIAHRGASGDAPENTPAAIELAAEQGAKWIEIDVNISKDGIPVLHHDDGINRCTDGQGLVIEHTLEHLQQLDSGSWFDARFADQKMPTLDACLDLAIELKLSINLEIKPCSGWELPATDSITDVLNNRRSLPQIIISSFSHICLQRAAQRAPAIPRGSLFLVAPPDWQTLTRDIDAKTLHLHANSLLSADAVQEFHDHGLAVYCYTVNTVEHAREVLALGVDGVFSNYPGELLKAGL